MLEFPIFQVDAFAEKPFSGNPAAVVILERWIEQDKMLSIASENNLAETAFIVPVEQGYEIRWFTPTVEVILCGHATLAAAYVAMNELNPEINNISFLSRKSGVLSVERKGLNYWLDFPIDTSSRVTRVEGIQECIGMEPTDLYRGKTDYIAVFPSARDIDEAIPNLAAISKLDARGLVITAKGTDTDFVSRFFAPQSGIDEDPVTGSAHTSLIPLWSSILGKTEMVAKQLSERGGLLHCHYRNDRCYIGGKAVLYLKGTIYIR